MGMLYRRHPSSISGDHWNKIVAADLDESLHAEGQILYKNDEAR